ncbi:hypothetical protein CMU30_14085 [Elizabethkingia anophelis]|nr:hypothetical protein [Elizabethkingia anophelis]MDV3684409.1 hypothetical protein [Elizabethkingia anophelis]MDV3699752.1 hypothetical protein [Elizabethkingia anophelis]MDV3763594.1 hypothetical protein [Elizabethkingia anophelis]MDV3802670.1 hypothetical protein [Elizabethkingia anophelis]
MKEKTNTTFISNTGFKERLNELVEYIRFTYKLNSLGKISESIGYARTNMSAALNGSEKYLTEGLADKFSKKYTEINKDWLLTGEGEMINTSQAAEIQNKDTSKPYINYNRMPAVITVQDDEEENIEAVPIKLAAGYVGGGYADQSFVEELPKFRLPYVRGGTFRSFEIQGYSMYNGIRDGDFFVGRFLDNIRDFGEGKIYALIIPEFESLLIKRVFRHPENPHILVLKSDNNDLSNIYPDIHLHVQYIAEMWSYAAVISLKEPHFDMDKSREIAATNPKIVSYTDK